MFTSDEYLREIKKRLVMSFNIERRDTHGSIDFDMLAVYEEITGRTFVSQVDIIDRLEKYERFYFKSMPKVGVTELEQVAEKMREWAEQFEPKNVDHMATVLTCILYSDNIEEDVPVWLSKFKYTKFYSFAMRGWCDVRFAVYDLANEKIYTCKKCLPVKEVFDPNVTQLSHAKKRSKAKRIKWF